MVSHPKGVDCTRAEALALVMAYDEAMCVAFLAVSAAFRSPAASTLNPVITASSLVRLAAEATPIVDRLRKIGLDSVDG